MADTLEGRPHDIITSGRNYAHVAIPRSDGTVPDPFQVGRELIVTGSLRGRTFVAQPDSMITKCPSKYSAAPSSSA